MLTESIVVIGAGGHGKVVLDALLACGKDRAAIRVRDGDTFLHGLDFMGGIIETPAVAVELTGCAFHLAIGNTGARQRLWGELLELGARPLLIVHPAASVSGFATLGEGSFVAAGAVVAPAASVGAGVIVNHGAVIDHDCIVGDFTHIAPNAVLGGRVKIGSGVLIGAGAAVLPGIEIGEGAIIGAGAVVTKNVGAAEIRTGVPARERVRGRV